MSSWYVFHSTCGALIADVGLSKLGVCRKKVDCTSIVECDTLGSLCLSQWCSFDNLYVPSSASLTG